MHPEQLKLLADQAAVIAKETASKLSKFDKKTAEVFYNNNMAFIQEHTIINVAEDNKAAAKSQRIKKFQAEAAKNSASASDRIKQNAEEMRKIIQEGNDKIRLLYQTVVETSDTSAG